MQTGLLGGGGVVGSERMCGNSSGIIHARCLHYPHTALNCSLSCPCPPSPSQGHIFSCNRKAKNPADRVKYVLSGHHGPLCGLRRNPFNPKYFLSIGEERRWRSEGKRTSGASGEGACR
jgi:hypothetical protein